MDNTLPIVGAIGSIILPVTFGSYILFYWLRSRARERMELLKQGIIPAKQYKASPNKYTMLRNGCLFVGMALGLLVGLIIDWCIDYSDFGTFLILLSSTTLFLGLGYIVFYLLIKDKPFDEE